MNLILEAGNILLLILCYLFDALASDKFCKSFFKISREKEAVFIVLCFGFHFLMNTVNEYRSLPYLVSVLISQIFLTGLVLLLFRADLYQKILAAALLITVRELVWNFSSSFLSCIILLTVKMIPLFPDGRGDVIGGPGSDIIGCLAYFAGIAAVLQMPKYLNSVFEKEISRWYLTLAAPLFLTTVMIDIMNFGAAHGILVRSGGNWGIYYDQLFSHMAICVVTALAMCALGFYVFGMDRIETEQREKEQYFSQIKFYQMLEEQYGQMEHLRHDLKNHIIAMQGLAQEEDWEKMKAYLLQMAETGGLEESEDVTGNQAVDALLYQKRRLAKSKNIRWNCEMQIPGDDLIPEFDLCVILGNILDNAVEACERMPKEERFIEIRAGMIKKCFLLEVKNSADIKKIEAVKRSRKRESGRHGIGMLNIRDAVERCTGILDVELENGIFILSVLIPLKKDAYDNKETS